MSPVPPPRRCCCQHPAAPLQINVNPECDIAGVRLAATLNGVPINAQPNIESAPNGQNGTMLRVTNLNLNVNTADGALICLKLGSNAGGNGCLTLDALCKPPPGGATGTCSTALYDTNFDCCPVSQVSIKPQPLLQPPLPPSPQPIIVPCDVCIDAVLTPPPFDIRPYRIYPQACQEYQRIVADAINNVVDSYGVGMTSRFAPDASRCEPLQMSVCGTFASATAAKSLQDEFQKQLPLFLEAAAAGGGGVCSPELSYYTVSVSTSGATDQGASPPAGPCIDVSSTASCFLPPTPDVNCT